MAIQQKLTKAEQAAYEQFKIALTALRAAWVALDKIESEIGLEIGPGDLRLLYHGVPDDSVESFLHVLAYVRENRV